MLSEPELRKIFHPYACSQMETFLKELPDPSMVSFVHYTSAEAALNIIKTKRLWMRNATAMADVSEVQIGFNTLQNVLFVDNNAARWNALRDALSECAEGSADTAFQFFNQQWSDISLNTYIASISQYYEGERYYGRLSMWRSFGQSPARVAIVVKFPPGLLEGNIFNLIVSPVAYLDKKAVGEEVDTVVKGIRENCEELKKLGHDAIVRRVYAMLEAAVTCLKHPGFMEEKEWRLIYAPKRWATSPLIEEELVNHYGIPQMIYKIPFDEKCPDAPPELANLDLARIFHRLIIGPGTYPYSMIQAFEKALLAAGVKDAESRIWPSDIPIRL